MPRAANIQEARRNVRLDVSDVDSVYLTSDMVDRAIQRAVDDLSRFLPLQVVWEKTLVFAISAESFTTAAAHGTYAALANKPIRYQSESVTSADGLTSYARDTDYYMDYNNGKITTISGGSMLVSTAYKVSYDISMIGIDISSITDLSKISEVEYPAGQVPQRFVSYSLHGNILIIGSPDNKQNQSVLAANNHVAVYYEKLHTMPTTTAPGSYDSVLEQVVCIGADSYALAQLATYHELLAISDLEEASDSLDEIAAIQTLSDTALDKVATYLDTQASDNANYWLTKITTDAATLRTVIASVLATCEAELGLLNTDLSNAAAISFADYLTGSGDPSAKKYLTDGDGLINATNYGSGVGLAYKDYALAAISIADSLQRSKEDYLDSATKRSSALASGVQAAATRINLLETYITQSEQFRKMAETYIYESNGRMGMIDRYLSAADKYVANAVNRLTIVDKLKADAQDKKNEFWTILRDKAAMRKSSSFVPVVQSR